MMSVIGYYVSYRFASWLSGPDFGSVKHVCASNCVCTLTATASIRSPVFEHNSKVMSAALDLPEICGNAISMWSKRRLQITRFVSITAD